MGGHSLSTNVITVFRNQSQGPGRYLFPFCVTLWDQAELQITNLVISAFFFSGLILERHYF